MKCNSLRFIILFLIISYSCNSSVYSHVFNNKLDIIITKNLGGEAALELATGDLSKTLTSLFDIETSLRTEIDLERAAPNSIFVIKIDDDLWQEKLTKKVGIVKPFLSEDGFIIKRINYNDKPLILISGNGVRGTSYGIFHFIERIKLDYSFAYGKIDIIKQPDMKIR
ncbi:MAG: alpha-glucuronidase family glycosyl hydrolase, partial [Bacteroidota bacterium]|nr:alpha-glucuronidase family glycosyl hydrolase [Bacteroidota bacterium]